MSECQHQWGDPTASQNRAFCIKCGAMWRPILSNRLTPRQASALGFPTRANSTGLLVADFDSFRRDAWSKP